MRDKCPTFTGNPAKRAAKVRACWRASSVVGATIAVWRPLIAAQKAARRATSVLPKPTSPHTSRSIGRPAARSSSVTVDRVRLVLRLVVGKAGAEFVVEAVGRDQPRRRAGHALGGDADQLAGHFAHALLQPRLARLPAGRAEPVELALLRAIARQQLEILNRQEQPVAAGVVNFEAIMRRAGRFDRLQPDEATDAVVDMDDEIARAQRRGFGEHVLGAALALGYAHQSVAEHVLLADDRQILGLEAALERDHRQRQRASPRALSLRPRGDELLRLQAVLGQDMAQALARAVAPAGDDDLQAALAQSSDVAHGGVEDIDILIEPLGREIAADPGAAVDDTSALRRRLERREPRQTVRGEPAARIRRRSR